MDEFSTKSRVLRLKVWGDNACFTRPEMKVERVSYDVMTPSAARGVLEAILWKRAIQWHILQIDVLKPIRWETVRRNEIGGVMSPRTDGLFIEEQRQQRAGLLLREVAYTIHAWFELTPLARPGEDNVIKFQEMFTCRATKGKCFQRPYLGCREFAADFAFIRHDEVLPEPIKENGNLGYMLYDICHDSASDQPFAPHFCTEGCRPSFFSASLEHGRLHVPEPGSEEVRS